MSLITGRKCGVMVYCCSSEYDPFFSGNLPLGDFMRPEHRLAFYSLCVRSRI